MQYWEPEGYYQLGEGKYRKIQTRAVLTRLKVVTKARTAADLAQWLETPLYCIADAKRRNIVPVRWLKLLTDRRLNFHPVWVLTGKGEACLFEWIITWAGARKDLPEPRH